MRSPRAVPLLVAIAAASAGPTAAQGLPHAGEGGLWVEVDGDELVAHWIVTPPDTALLRVLEGDRVLREFRVPPTERAEARFPAGRRPVLLRYGSTADGTRLHETLVDPAPPARAPTLLPAMDSIFIVGDVHGEFERLRRLLRQARLVDTSDRWAGGGRHLFFLGDLVDRGADVMRTLWFVYRLEREAAEAGGGVHVVLGNHEIMAFAGDDRYVAPEDALLAQRHGVPHGRLLHPRRSVLGRWLASKPAMLRVGRVLLAHGGVTRAQLGYGLESFDDSLATFTGEELLTRWFDSTYAAPVDSAAFARRLELLWGEQSVFWHRGYIETDTLAEELDEVLDHFAADILVVGHTPVDTIQARYGGAVIAAHPRRPAEELLLLVRTEGAFEWRRVGGKDDAGGDRRPPLRRVSPSPRPRAPPL